MLKTCPKCAQELPVEDFARDKSRASGRMNICRRCDSVKGKRYYEANRGRKLAYHAERRANLPPKPCRICGAEVPHRRYWYCDRCRSARKRHKSRVRELKGRKPSAERGYGAEHRKLRRQLEPAVKAGRAKCWRCGELIAPGEGWDLGHDDADRSVYRGPEHRKCNRATTGRKPPVVRASRSW